MLHFHLRSMDHEIPKIKVFTQLQGWHSQPWQLLAPDWSPQRTYSSAEEKGKAPAVINEGSCPLDGQFRKAASYSTNDDSATHDTAANATKTSPQATAPRVMTDRELLISLHQKVDRNLKWVKRQFGSILYNMTSTHNAVKKNHYYLHEVFDRTWAILSHLYGE